MQFTAKQIAELLQGKIEGNPDAAVNNLSKIEEGAPGTLSFLANPLYTPHIYSTKASIVIVRDDLSLEKPVQTTLVRVKDPYSCFAKLLEMYNQIKLDKKGVSEHAFIAKTAKIGKDVYVGAFAYIGENAVIGNNVKIYPQVYVGDNVVVKENTTLFQGVKIYSECLVGSNCIIHAGTVIGSDGFGFVQQADLQYKKVAQIGNVIVEDNVEMGANCAIDRATLGSTIIHKGVKLDNLVHVAHNVEIGENSAIAGQTGISGSAKVGKNCMTGGQVGIVGHITVADNVKIAGQSGIGASIKQEGSIVQGSPAFDVHDYQRSYVHFRNLTKILKRLEAVEEQLKKK